MCLCLWPQFYLLFPFLPVGLCVSLSLTTILSVISLSSCGALCVSVSDHNSICYFPFFLWGFVCLWQLCVPLTALELQFYLLSISLLPVGLCVPLTALCATNSSKVAILSAEYFLTSCGALCVSVSDHNFTYLLSTSLSSFGALCVSDSFVCH